MKAGVDYIGVGVGAWIVNDKGEVLLVKRSQQAKNEKGKWEIPGGAVDFGETLEQAIKREMKEELGIDIEIIEQWTAKDHIISEDKQHWIPTTFLVRAAKGQIPKIQEPHKHDALGWFLPDKFPAPLSIISQLDLEEYKKHLS